MNGWMERWTRARTALRLDDLGLFVLRAGFGGLMVLGHGWGKVAHYSTMADKFMDPLGLGPHVSLALAAFAEFFAALLVVLGLFTRPALVVLVIEMGVAAFIQHAGAELAVAEKALLYFTAFASLLLTGPGRFSLDHLIFGRRGGA